MNQITETFHNLGSLLEGKSTFSQFMADEGAMIEADIAKIPAVLQAPTLLMYDSLKAGASILVGAGRTAVGPILAESSDLQATQVLNVLSKFGIPTVGPLSIAEHAVLVTVIGGLKAGLDKIGLQIGTQVAAPTQVESAPTPAEQPAV